jgi:hypothetical protein
MFATERTAGLWEKLQPVRQKRCASLHAFLSSYDRLRLSELEVRCRQLHPEAASVAVQVSSHCDQRTFVRWKQVNSREFGDSIFCRPHQSTYWEFRLKLDDAENPLVRQHGRHLRRPKADWSHPRVTEVDWYAGSQPRLSIKRRPSRRNEYSNYSATWLRFSMLFLGCKVNVRV